jgi:hypothetical protein
MRMSTRAEHADELGKQFREIVAGRPELAQGDTAPVPRNSAPATHSSHLQSRSHAKRKQ